MNDVIGNSDMIQGSATTFIQDRFGSTNAALALNGGFTRIPSGIFFNAPQFTISAWVFCKEIGLNAPLIDFGNGAVADNIIVRLGSSGFDKPALRINNGSSSMGTAQSIVLLKNLTWTLLTVTFNGTEMLLYLNATQHGSYYSDFVLPTITRLYNYVGKSNTPTNGFSWSYIDDLRFYNKSLTKDEILDLMNKNNESMFFEIF